MFVSDRDRNPIIEINHFAWRIESGMYAEFGGLGA